MNIFDDMTDERLATEVRMLMRNDLLHEAVVCAARDRILKISRELANLRAERDAVCGLIAGDTQILDLPPYVQTLVCNARTWRLIDQLRQREGASVMLFCDNADFNEQPNSAIEVSDDWTNWQDRRFTGETVTAALEAALLARAAVG